MSIVVTMGPVVGLIAQCVGIVSTCVGIYGTWLGFRRATQQPAAQAIPQEVAQQQTTSAAQLARRLLLRRLALGGAALALLAVTVLLGPAAFAKRPAWTSQAAFGIGMVALLVVMGLLAIDRLLTDRQRRSRRLALAGAAWVLSLSSGPIAPYVFHSHQYRWAPVVLSGTALAALITVSLLVLDPWSTDVLPRAHRLALGTIALSSLVAAAILHTRAPWWHLDLNLEYAFYGVVAALLIVTGLLAAEGQQARRLPLPSQPAPRFG